MKHLDLADMRTVRALAQDVLDHEERLDRLILNAGIMACPLSYTQQGFEIQMGVNHFGHFLLTQQLLEKMRAQVGPVLPLMAACDLIGCEIELAFMKACVMC